MKIRVAGEEKVKAEGITVAKLIIEENVETPEYVTVSVNDEFIEKEKLESYELKDGDNVEFIYFMGGGR